MVPVYTPGDTSKAELFCPETIIVNTKGEIIYADERSHRLTKIANGKVIALAGNNIIDPCGQNIGGRAQEGHKDGKALTALFGFPKGLAYDSKGNLYIAEEWNNCIRKLSPDGIVSSYTKFDKSKARYNYVLDPNPNYS
jgi:sugar lactone lactonase YvrE